MKQTKASPFFLPAFDRFGRQTDRLRQNRSGRSGNSYNFRQEAPRGVVSTAQTGTKGPQIR
ncbi:hypothetical protein BACCAP_04263 [Pseudoflavonifractor capillosus ATCC 29799]|uniref:Uncharacterized protein n=1 Tax=Pseudoflavonifractor capillosus ATCC 29799 TaxID=411467 RepID=A6P196_9FIRM|nr:hypothetical protein BACCAP_04263 [Pseudoflavonifractor capillosus ATCC 29799]